MAGSSVAPTEAAQAALDVDSTTESDSASTYTASITSSVTNFLEEHGRRYHAFREGRYLLPNDETEAERLDIHHAIFLAVYNGNLHLAPIKSDVQRVIDLGTGTGIWAIDFADQYPSVQVIGNDLSPIQPVVVPPNLQLFVDDFEDSWGYEDQPFDYVHARFLAGSILDWPKLMRQAYQCTKPGGWIEFQDLGTSIYSPDPSLTPNHWLAYFHRVTSEAQEVRGYDMAPGRSLEKWLRDAGFINLQCAKFIVPLGTWPRDKYYKNLGAYNLLQMDTGLEGIGLASLTRGGQVEAWRPEEAQVLLAKARQDLRNPQIHAQYDLREVPISEVYVPYAYSKQYSYAAYGQKPG